MGEKTQKFTSNSWFWNVLEDKISGKWLKIDKETYPNEFFQNVTLKITCSKLQMFKNGRMWKWNEFLIWHCSGDFYSLRSRATNLLDYRAHRKWTLRTQASDHDRKAQNKSSSRTRDPQSWLQRRKNVAPETLTIHKVFDGTFKIHSKHIYINHICWLTKFNIPNSMKWLKVKSKVSLTWNSISHN